MTFHNTLLIAIAIVVSSIPARGATFTNLGTLPGYANSYGLAINAGGNAVVGYVETPGQFNQHAFRWTQGGMEDLGVVISGGQSSYATGVSASGLTIAGFSGGGFGWLGFRWNSGAVNNLGFLPGAGIFGFSQGYNISADGSTVVGVGGTFGGDRAFRWTLADGMQNLGVLPGDIQSVAQGVNQDGSVVVGRSSSHAFRWTQAGGMQDLGVLPGWATSDAVAVSASGAAVTGFSRNAGGNGRAFRWTFGEGLRNLGVLPDGARSEGAGISNDGATIAGRCLMSGGLYHAFLWRNESGIVDLNTYLPTLGLDLTGWTLTVAQGVSADGTALAGSGVFRGADRAWVVTGLPPAILIPCSADIAPPGGNHVVDVDDLLAVIMQWGPCPAPPASCSANIVVTGTSTNRVDVDDLLAVITAWGACP